MPWTAPLLDGVNVVALGLMAAVTGELAHSAIVDPLTVALALLAALVLGVQARIVKLASNEPASA